METPDKCNEYRVACEDGATSDLLESHASACPDCQHWRRENADLIGAIRVMPQFDVPEHLTQRILANVDSQTRHQATNALLVPAVVAAGALAVTVAPLDSIEGFAASAVCIVLMFVVHQLLKTANTEEVVA